MLMRRNDDFHSYPIQWFDDCHHGGQVDFPSIRAELS